MSRRRRESAHDVEHAAAAERRVLPGGQVAVGNSWFAAGSQRFGQDQRLAGRVHVDDVIQESTCSGDLSLFIN